MSKQTIVISTCKRTSRSKWANNTPKNVDKGMKMIVEHEVVKNGKIKSTTKFII